MITTADATLDSIGDAVLSTDLAGRVTYLNPAAERMTGWSREAAAGQPLDRVFRIIDRETREAARDPMTLAVRLNKTVGLTPNCLLVARDGRELEIEDSAAPIHDETGEVIGAVIVFRDVGAALERSRQMTQLAQHDTLTGLPNRLLMTDRLTEAIALAHRHGKPVGVLFLDVDRFKSVNDSLGHAAGDQLLREIGSRLTASLRMSDTVSRLGGDEFLVVLTELERAEDALIVARKLSRTVCEINRSRSAHLAVSISLGVAIYPQHGMDADTLVANADAAMYDAKRHGPGGVRLFGDDLVSDSPTGPVSPATSRAMAPFA